MTQIFVDKTPQIGAVLDVKTSTPPQVEQMVEIIRHKEVCAVGIVTEVTGDHTYQVLVIA